MHFLTYVCCLMEKKPLPPLTEDSLTDLFTVCKLKNGLIFVISNYPQIVVWCILGFLA